MKKLLAILLAATMFVTVFVTSASADTVTVVGSKNESGYTGADTIDTPATSGKDLNINVSDVTHKYAVDVTFNLSDLTIGGTITWNVNDLKYDVAGTTLADSTQNIKVSNRSDLSVYAYATVTNTDDDDGITVTADKNSATNRLTIEKARAKSGATPGAPTEGTLTISITSADWNAVAEYYAAKKIADQSKPSFTFATVTVTITKD